MNVVADNSIIALDKFIQSTRDSGYKNTASAISELVDNAIQASAHNISILIQPDDSEDTGIRVAVVDDGSGMDRRTLIQAMRFGGSSRFNSREGLGRFGMGLPNSSLSQARRVVVYSWQKSSAPQYTYLDVEEIASGTMVKVPDPLRVKLPGWLGERDSVSGTVIVWESCDRLDHRRISTIERKLVSALGRIFRHYIWAGIKIDINGQVVAAIDPLFRHKGSTHHGAKPFQDAWEIELYSNPADSASATGKVEVVFTELPIKKWHSLPNDEKRAMGVSNNAGTSIVRGSREVDYGWFFMGSKRRENYDDWWRCEIRFDPVLDEAFGITHTKQQIRPKEYLLEALQPYMETMAKALNGRVRQAHIDIKVGDSTINAEQVAQARDKKMRPLPTRPATPDAPKELELEGLAKRHGGLRQVLSEPKVNGTRYQIIEDELGDACFFKPLVSDGLIVGVVNPRHRFYKSVYKPVLDSKDPQSADIANALQLMMLAAARAEASFTERRDIETLERFRHEWSQAMDVLLAAR